MSRARERLLVGWREWIHLPDLLGLAPIKVKVDTGARTSALHAWDVEPFTEHGQEWIRFCIHPFEHDDDHVFPTEARLVGERRVRSSNGAVERRPVITTTLHVGDHRYRAEVTLTNRDEMGFRMLLGRSSMARHLIVDPGRSWLLGGDGHTPPPNSDSATR